MPSQNHRLQQGRLEVICGSMFSGKTQELLRRINRANYANKQIVVFSPALDTRTKTKLIVSHDGQSQVAHTVDSLDDIINGVMASTEIIAFDEIQFFPSGVIPLISKLLQQGKQVITSGLDMDFRGQPFPITANLMALADSTTKLKAICKTCSGEAHFSQRLIDGMPAHYDDPIILMGASESYQPRCRSCFIIQTGPRTSQIPTETTA
jgi:thymidine kinase